jgi:predicted ArsR family transcriptional regulator
MEGLIAAEEERHGVGRPRLVYSLTEDGMEKFPTKYLRLTTRLLAQMKESMPGPAGGASFSTRSLKNWQANTPADQGY